MLGTFVNSSCDIKINIKIVQNCCRNLAVRGLIASKGLILVRAVKLKPMIKGQISGRMVSSGISHVAFASVYSEKTRMKKCWIMIIIIMKKSQETTVFGGC